MFFSLKEIVKWLGLTVFEVWLNVAGLLVFSVLLVLRLQDVLDATWWHIFLPLFLSDGLNAYFCVIVFIRTLRDRQYRQAALRFLSSIVYIVCLFVCKLLFCQKLSGESNVSYGEVFASIFVALQLLMVRGCQVH